MCYDEIISIDKKNNELHIKYKNKSKTVIFSLNEKYRSFSFCNNINKHIILIKNELNCQIIVIK